jgi:Xaa-Pro dipeptidase
VALHFSLQEFGQRQAATVAELQRRGLDGLLMFRQESMYYLTGYDTFGYVFFQCLYLGADGRLMLLTRSPDRLQAKHTSVIEDIRIWVDGPEATPAAELREILRAFGVTGRKLGVEYDAYGLTAANGKRLDAAMDGFATLTDASDLVTRLRVRKSPAEIAYVRRAAALADDALDAAHATIRPQAFEGDILAAMQGAVFRGGGDYPGNEFIIGSGRDGLLCRYFSGRRHLDAEDQITLEFAGVDRHYHSCLMRTIPVGRARPLHTEMHKVAMAALHACLDALRPGAPIGKVFDAYAATCARHGMADYRLNACGYSLGTTFSPNWMDWPMFYAGNPVPAEPGMVFFLHMILIDGGSTTAMCPGTTVLVGERGNEMLSQRPLDLVVK